LSISTVKPPFTRPVMVPVTISDLLNDSSRRVQVRARLAFSRERRVSPVPSSMAVEGDFDAVAGLDLDLAAFVLELLERDDRFGLQAHVDDDHVVAYVDDRGQ
jgi:hypothetical protein